MKIFIFTLLFTTVTITVSFATVDEFYAKTWRHLKERVYPNIGINVPIFTNTTSVSCIHILLFAKYDVAYGCNIDQTSKNVVASSYVLSWNEKRKMFDYETPLLTNTKVIDSGAHLFELIKSLEMTNPEGRLMSLGHPITLCVIIKLKDVVQCYYYDVPNKERVERNLVELTEFANEVFAISGLNGKILERIKEMLLG